MLEDPRDILIRLGEKISDDAVKTTNNVNPSLVKTPPQIARTLFKSSSEKEKIFQDNLNFLLEKKGPAMFLNELLQRNPEITPKQECKEDFPQGQRTFQQKMEIADLGIVAYGTSNVKAMVRGKFTCKM